MPNNLTIDEAIFIVVDFETVTPKGRPPEPIELAAIRVGPLLKEVTTSKFDTLIRPPEGAPVTPFDTAQTGIRPTDVLSAPDVNTVLANFEAWCGGEDVVFVAQNARYESSIFQRFSSICRTATRQPFVDTVLLAKTLSPAMSTHRLDSLATRYQIDIPINRHRAMPDVELTAKVFARLIDDGQRRMGWRTILDLLGVGGIVQNGGEQRKKGTDDQMSLF